MSSVEELKGAIYRCHHCRACNLTDSDEIGWHKVCPTYEAYPFEHYAAGGRNAIARAWLEGFIDRPEGIVEAIYTCLGCGACKEICQAYTEVAFPMPDGVDTPRIMRAMRQELMARGLAPKVIKTLDQGVKKTKNAFGGDQSAKKKFAEELNLPSRGENLFFAGCYSFFGGLKHIPENAVKIFTSSKTQVSFLGEQEWCCGILQYVNGNIDLCKEMVAHNLEAIKQSGAKRVITTCAGCYHALKTVYPHIAGKELSFQVLHTSQYLSQLLEEKNLEFKRELKATVTYHDPCHLGRLSRAYEEPRNVLKHIPGLTFREMEKTKEQAWCCGGGEGIVSLAYPQMAAEIGNERIRQAQQTGATTIITTCPHCNTVLNVASKRLNISLNCKDLIDLVAEAMGL
jgi:heterodisulfide reductase subunit D